MMKQKAKQVLKNPLIYGSGIVVFGNLVAYFFFFLFNLFVARQLSIEDYGILASLMSIISFPALAGNAITPTIINFAGTYFAKNDVAYLRGFYLRVAKLLILFALAIFFIFLIFIPQLGSFFHINNHFLLILTDIIIFFSFIGVINMAFLQAKLAFGFQVFINFINATVKLVLGVILVLLGYAIYGAVSSIVIAGIISYFASFYPLKFLWAHKVKIPHVSLRQLFAYGFPSAITMLCVTAFISVDILLVKHFFEPAQAGLYAGLSLVGRVIFYFSGPIVTVMFPLLVQKYNKGESVANTFKLALLIVFLPSVCMTIFYFMFPEFVLTFFLKKEEYLAVSEYVGMFAIFTSLYALFSLIVSFYLSVQKTKIVYPVAVGALAQIILISLFHKTFFEVILLSICIIFSLVLILLLYYPYAFRKKTNN